MATLTIYPTSIALRQWQKRQMRATTFLDTRHHISLAGFFGACADAALRAGRLTAPLGTPLRGLNDLEQEIAIMQTVTRFLNGNPAPHSVIARLPAMAVEEILAELARFVDPLADGADEFLKQIENLYPANRPGPQAPSGKHDTPGKLPAASRKNAELARLYRLYDETCVAMNRATHARVNAAILAVLRERALWPACLHDVARVQFVGLRWAQPFVERVSAILARHLGPDNVHQVYILQEHEHEFWGRQLMARSGTILFAGESGSVDADPMDRFVDLREGLAVRDSELAASTRDKVGFSHSVGVYGEVEDIARRIIHYLRQGVRADEICLTARNLGEYSDPIIDVFARFGIPHYFRRGIPLMSTPLVKTIMDMLRFSVSPERNTFCALLESPWLDWTKPLGADSSEPGHPSQLADDIRRAGVEPKITAELLEKRLTAFHSDRLEAAAVVPRVRRALQAFHAALGQGRVTSLLQAIHELQARLQFFRVEDKLRELADSSAATPDTTRAYVLNAKACQAFSSLLERLKSTPQPTNSGSNPFSRVDMITVVNRALNNMTISDPQGTDSGVWILSPYDVAGLHFQVVIVAGLNSGGFPIIPRQSAVFHDNELDAVRQTFAPSLGPALPDTALATSTIRGSQENLLFLSLLTAATGRLVLSRISRDENGEEVTPSIFHTMLWRLVGWPAFDDLPDAPPDEYDAWRLAAAPEVFASHWKKQRHLDRHHRMPFPGESFLGAIPPALCGALDEARQSVMAGNRFPATPVRQPPDAVAEHVHLAAEVETARFAYFDAQAAGTGEAAPTFDGRQAPYIGVIGPEIWNLIFPSTGRAVPDFSPTELATVATCPYRYYLQRIMKLDELQTNELEAQSLDRGTVLHEIMNTGFRLLRGDPDARSTDPLDLQKRYHQICTPALAIHRATGWALEPTGKPTGPDSLPVIVFDPDRREDYLSLFMALIDRFEADFSAGNRSWKLGAREQVGIEWRKLRRSVHNLVSLQFDPAMNSSDAGDIVRCTALLEHTFNSQKHDSTSPSIEIVAPAGDARFRMHGKIDRVDLLFRRHEPARLAGVSVLDYKGSAGKTPAMEIMAGIIAATDCQAPAYTLAAIDRLFGGPAPAGVPVIFHYLSYTLNLEEMVKNFEKNGLDIYRCVDIPAREAAGDAGEPRQNVPLLDLWRRQVFACLDILRKGEFIVKSHDCKFCPFRAVCRHSESLLHGEEEEEA